jgi:energy-coupling factor transporter ATP-binding protein EcfA2
MKITKLEIPAGDPRFWNSSAAGKTLVFLTPLDEVVDTVVIRGPSGSGKTAILDSLWNLAQHSGRVRYVENPCVRTSEEAFPSPTSQELVEMQGFWARFPTSSTLEYGGDRGWHLLREGSVVPERGFSHGEASLLYVAKSLFLGYNGVSPDLILLDEPCRGIPEDWEWSMANGVRDSFPDAQIIAVTESSEWWDLPYSWGKISLWPRFLMGLGE